MRGIVSKMRFVALVGLCLVAPVTAQAHSQVSFVPTLGFTTATFTFSTLPAARVAVALGTDPKYLIPTYDSVRIKHKITVRGLSPDTLYYGTITTTPGKGKSKTVKIVPFRTLAAGAVPATLSTTNGKFLLNGQRSFVVMGGDGAFNPCPSTATLTGTLALGARIFDANDSGAQGCENEDPSQWAATLHSQLNGLWWRERDSASEQQLRSQGLGELLNWQAATEVISSPSPQALENPCESSTQLFKGVSAAAHTKAVVFRQSLATHPILPSRTTCVTPANLSMAFWTVVAACGLGIDYSTRDAGHGSEFDVSTELCSRAALLAARLETLGPVILGGKCTHPNSSPGSLVKFGAWQYGGISCVVAVNTGNSPTRGSFSWTNIKKARTAQVMWEGKNARVVSGSITDTFQPQAAHIYLIK